MTITSAIIHESRTNRVFRKIAPFALLIALVALILIPGFVAAID